MSHPSEQPPAVEASLPTPPERVVRVKGVKGLVADADATVVLALRPDGLWLEAQAAGQEPRRVDVLAAQPLTYQSKVLGDHLIVGEHDVAVPTGKGGEVQRMIGIARIRRSAGERATGGVVPNTPWRAPFYDKRSDVELEWLRFWLQDGEIPLACLDTGTDLQIDSPLAPSEKTPCFYLLTSQRAALVAVGALGDSSAATLATAPLQFKDGIGRTAVSAGEHQWHSSLTNGTTYKRIASLAEVHPDQRSMVAARMVWLSASGDQAQIDWAHGVLRQREADGDVWAGLTAALLYDERPLRTGVLSAFVTKKGVAPLLAAWADDWQIAEPTQRALVAGFRCIRAYACAAELNEHWRKMASKTQDRGIPAALIDLRLYEDLRRAGYDKRAIASLRAALKRLPSSAVQQLVAHTPPPVEGGVMHTRVKVLSAMYAAVRRNEAPVLPVLHAMVSATPLERGYLKAFVEASAGDVRERARRLLSVVAPGGLRGEDKAPQAPLRGGAKVVAQDARPPQSLLQRSLREGEPLEQLHQQLTNVMVPDAAATRAYCDAIAHDDSPGAHAAVASARAIVNMHTGVELLVARGAKSLGVRGFEGPPPFIVIGACHLDAADERHLGPSELTFAIVSEVAHIKLGHARLTCQDVWRNAFTATDAGGAAALTAFPQLAPKPFGPFAAPLFESVAAATPAEDLQVLWHAPVGDAQLDPTFAAQPELVAVRRAMQITADRAGLLAVGDFGACLRAMLKTSPVEQIALADTIAAGLATVLSARQEDNSLRHADLVARFNALAAFWLSEDYETLRGMAAKKR